MKKLLTAIMAAGLCLAPSFAQAAPDTYISFSGSVGLMEDSDLSAELVSVPVTVTDVVKYDTGFAFDLAYGNIRDIFRIETAVGYQRAEAENIDDIFYDIVNAYYDIDLDIPYINAEGSIDILSLMVNAYYDIDLDQIQPYVMAGIGYAYVHTEYGLPDYKLKQSKDNSAFAYQGGAGIAVPVTEQLLFDVGYRYFATTDVEIASDVDLGVVEIASDVDLGVANHKILAGIRYTY